MGRIKVALRKESVDRNCCSLVKRILVARSLSARRAWIEISLNYKEVFPWLVALRKESVDRNTLDSGFWLFGLCRSPQGERG